MPQLRSCHQRLYGRGELIARGGQAVVWNGVSPDGDPVVLKVAERAASQAIGDESGLFPRLASGFGGGMAGAGGTCGALVGAVMTVGLVHGRSAAGDDRAPSARLTSEIVAAFEEEMGSTSCRELTGLDLRTQEGMRGLREGGVGATVCRKAIATAESLALARLGQSAT